jgi:bla regulator protein blaR1
MRFIFTYVLVLTLWNVQAQTAPVPLTFEVTSIKPSAPDVLGFFFQPQPGGNLRITGATLKNLIAVAYDAREFAISGGPGWVNSDRFDIEARAAHLSASENSHANAQQMRERLKSLLAERFQLAIHPESKEQNVYALFVGKSGPKLHEAAPGPNPMIRKRGTSIIGEGVGMQMLVLNLANALDRPVVDKTNLTGRYDFKLGWILEARSVSGPIAVTSAETSTAPQPDGPSLFAALQEQLGLRLEPQKARVETLLIDHVARPSEN